MLPNLLMSTRTFLCCLATSSLQFPPTARPWLLCLDVQAIRRILSDQLYRPSATKQEANCSTLRGGEEVLLDVGGEDATEAFEDVGHSDEAREILDGLLVGSLKRVVCLLFLYRLMVTSSANSS